MYLSPALFVRICKSITYILCIFYNTIICQLLLKIIVKISHNYLLFINFKRPIKQFKLFKNYSIIPRVFISYLKNQIHEILLHIIINFRMLFFSKIK